MIPGLLDALPPLAAPDESEPHVLVVARDASSRFCISDLLLETGVRVTMAATFGVVELLLGSNDAFDLLVVTQSSEETTLFGVPQLARSMDPDLPILVLEAGTANSPAVIELVQGALSRWPLRERACPSVH